MNLESPRRPKPRKALSIPNWCWHCIGSSGCGVDRSVGTDGKGRLCCGCGCGVEERKARRALLCDEWTLPGPMLWIATAKLGFVATCALPFARASLAAWLAAGVEGGCIAGALPFAAGVEGGGVCCDMMILAWCDLNEFEGWVAKNSSCYTFGI